MARLRAWLRSSRSLVILFILVTILPAAALVVLGVRLLEQERALVVQRRREALERAADQSIRMLDKELALWRKRLGRGAWGDTRADSAYVILRQGSIEVHPSGRLPYLVEAAALKEASETPFAEMESHEFSQHNLQKALEISRRLAGSQDIAVRAGALLREGRILRKLGRADEALEAYRRLGGVQGVGLAGIPMDLVARRSRCAILEEQSRADTAAKEAAEIEADLRQGRWQLDRASCEHVIGQLSHWLGVPVRAQPEGEALAAAADSLYRRWTEANGEFEPAGARSQLFEGRPVLGGVDGRSQAVDRFPCWSAIRGPGTACRGEKGAGTDAGVPNYRQREALGRRRQATANAHRHRVAVDGGGGRCRNARQRSHEVGACGKRALRRC